jgi:DNA-binding NtrC family response regulator
MAGATHESTSEFHWQAIFESVSDPLFVLSPARRILYVNRAWEKATGWSAAKASGMVCARRSLESKGPIRELGRALYPPRGVLQGKPGHARRLAPQAAPVQVWWDIDFSPFHAGGVLLGVIGRIHPLAAGPEGAVQGLTEKLAALRERMTQRFKIDLLTELSPRNRRLSDQARSAARIKAPVLIVGEPGSGKQWLARAIHYESAFRDQTFVRVNCGLHNAILSEMIFGDRGLLTRAEIGTVYVDQPHTLPRDLQARLADYVAKAREMGPRLMAGCASDPLVEVRSGRFADELFGALGILMLTIPPLRERRGELASLIAVFLDRAEMRNGKPGFGVSAESLEILQSYTWPNNLRELYSVLAAAQTRAGEKAIEPEDLPAAIRLAERLQEAAEVEPERNLPLDQVLEQVERRLIVLALRRFQGNRSKAAEWLQVWRPRLIRRIEALGIKVD